MDRNGRKSPVTPPPTLYSSPLRRPHAWFQQGSQSIVFACLLHIPFAHAQTSDPANFVPLPDPGYGLYYHDAEGAPNAATRWGYHDGWIEGRHDRNHGEIASAQGKGSYATPPEHGGYAGMTRDQYEKLYRMAYLHGYEHGSRL